MRLLAQTGLPRQNAALAARRLFSEPGLFSGSEDEKRLFEAYMEHEGLTARQGGRYYTLSFGATKADQMQSILATQRSSAQSITSIALVMLPMILKCWKQPITASS